VPARVGVVAVVETAARGSRVRPRVLEAAVRRPTAAAPNFYIMTCFLLRDHYCRQQVGEPPWPSCRDDRVDVIRATEARNIEVDAGWTPSQLSATHPEACRNAAAVPRGTLCVLQKRRRGESSGPGPFRRSASASGASSSPNHRTEQPPLATFTGTSCNTRRVSRAERRSLARTADRALVSPVNPGDQLDQQHRPGTDRRRRRPGSLLPFAGEVALHQLNVLLGPWSRLEQLPILEAERTFQAAAAAPYRRIRANATLSRRAARSWLMAVT
jgi:hypothetical protein